VFYIRCRKKGRKRWGFLTSTGGCNRLKIYAARFETAEKAHALIYDNAAISPEWEWQVMAAEKA
jgi:hypothetical protein